jgi:chromosome segregation ATPase
MTHNPPPDRLDRMEQILAGLLQGQAATQRQIDTLASNQVEERDRRSELREDIDTLGHNMRQISEAQDRTERNLERLSERQDRTQQQVDRTSATVDRLGERVDQLGVKVDQVTEQMGGLAIQMEEMLRNAEQDRSQAAIDRAEFRSTVQQLLEVLSQRLTSNEHSD